MINTIADKAVNKDKKQNILANKKLSTTTNKTINAIKKQNFAANK